MKRLPETMETLIGQSRQPYRLGNDGSLDNLAGAEINLAHLRQTGEIDDELTRIDALTPFYKERVEHDLSPQQRKILATLVMEGKPLRIREIARYARLEQQNRASAQVHRLVKKGYLKRDEDGTYRLSTQDPDFERFCVARWTEFVNVWASEKSQELIPDREHPISYFIEHRSEIKLRLYQR